VKRRNGGRLRPPFRPRAWAARHLQVLISSLGRLWRRPLGNFMSILVIAIALALPTGLHLLVHNLERLAGGWQGAASATLFLRREISDDQVKRLLKQLREDPAVGLVRHLTPAQALDDFRRHSGMADAITLLETNPLPHVVMIRPADPHIAPARFKNLVERLRKRPEVERAIADLQWVERFQGMVDLVRRSALLLSALLSLAVLLVIGNTIRLEIQSRRDEIEIVKLVGGSQAFIRRPFLYEGFWYGLLGAILALVLLAVSLVALRVPVARLAHLYASDFTLKGPGFTVVLLLLAAGSALGVLGAWVAVRQQLRRIEPH